MRLVRLEIFRVRSASTRKSGNFGLKSTVYQPSFFTLRVRSLVPDDICAGSLGRSVGTVS